MPNIPSISGKDFIKIIENLGFQLTRINGSHHRFKHQDGRTTTIPVHGNKDLPKGLIRTIIKEDLEMVIEDIFA
jgi:predicted RNA binding protein YcfA (HicA-like mRNA interferase family)